MQPRTKIGLIVGVIGLVLNICVSGILGFCGPVLSLIAGAVAGYLAVQREKPFSKNDGARTGATAGGIAGGFIILGQLLGGIAALAFMQASGAPTILGPMPDLSGDPAAAVGFYAGGLGTALCFGVVGALLAAGAGAGAGYLTTSDGPTMPPPENIMAP